MNKRKETNKIIVHCSATKPSMDIDAKEIDRWHRRNGWLMIGYHYVIKRDGCVQIGREEDVIGAHVSGHNDDSVGICMVGGVNDAGKAEQNFTTDQYESLAALLYSLEKKYPQAQVSGHRDWTSHKECPSFDVRSWWNKQKSDDISERQIA